VFVVFRVHVQLCVSLFLCLVPLNDKQTLEQRALSFDRDDEAPVEPGLEEVLKAKKPKELRKGNPSSFSFYLSLYVSYQVM